MTARARRDALRRLATCGILALILVPRRTTVQGRGTFTVRLPPRSVAVLSAAVAN